MRTAVNPNNPARVAFSGCLWEAGLSDGCGLDGLMDEKSVDVAPPWNQGH